MLLIGIQCKWAILTAELVTVNTLLQKWSPPRVLKLMYWILHNSTVQLAPDVLGLRLSLYDFATMYTTMDLQ